LIIRSEHVPSLRGMLSIRPDIDLRDDNISQLASLNGSLDVIVLGANDPSTVAHDVAAVRERTSAPVVIALGRHDDVLLQEVLTLDPADVLVLPQPPEIIAFTIRKAAEGVSGHAASGPLGKVITIFSPKGGSGKSVVATNLAVAMARAGRQTLLIDLDLQFGDAALMMSLDREKTLFDLVSAPGDLDADKLRGYLLAHPSGVAVLAAPPRPQDGDRIDDKRIASLIEVARGTFDAIIIDTAPLFDVSMLTALDRSDELLLVCGHDIPSLKNVRLGLETLDLLSFPRDRVKLVANRQGMRGGIKTSELAEILGHELRFVLPEDDSVPTCVNRGAPLMSVNDRSSFARAVRDMAGQLLATPAKPGRGAFGGKLRGKRR